MRKRLKISAITGRAASFLERLRGLRPSDFVKRVAETFATQVVMLLLGIVTSVMITRLLGPEGRGVFAVATTLSAIGVQIGTLGLTNANTLLAAKDRSLLPALVGNALVVSLVVGAFLALAFLGLAALWPGITPLRGSPLALALLGIGLGMAWMYGLNFLLSVQDTRNFNRVSLCNAVLFFAFILLLLAERRASPAAVLEASLLATVLAGLWAFQQIRRFAPIKFQFNRPLFKTSMNYGSRFYVLYSAAFMIVRSDMLIVGAKLGEKQAGFYAVAGTLAGLIGLLPMVVGMILLPRLAAMEDPLLKWRIARQASLVSGAILLLISALSIAAARPLILHLYGPRFEPSVPAFLWLLPGAVFYGLTYTLNAYAGSVKPRTGQIVGYYACFGLNVALNILFLRRYGIVFAAANSSLCYALMLGTIWHFGTRPMIAEAHRHTAKNESQLPAL